MEFMEKLASLVPPPRAHQVRFHGFLAPHSKVRSKLATSRKALKEKEKGKEENNSDDSLNKAGKIRWARLLKRVFRVDIEICMFCGGKTKILSAIHDDVNITRILKHIGLDPNPPPIKPARQTVMGF